MFLKGQSDLVIDELVERMQSESAKKNYEIAAKYRDQINQLREMQLQQIVNKDQGEVDVIAMVTERNFVCAQILMILNGKMIGNHSYFSRLPSNMEFKEAFSAFIKQHYLDKTANIPKEIIMNSEINDEELLQNALAKQLKHRVKLKIKVRGEKAQWLRMATLNAKEALHNHLGVKKKYHAQLVSLQKIFKLTKLPHRIECFDVSHMQGEAVIASCVVFTANGASKSNYRLFNIKNVVAGDDYAALRQALLRRYKRVKKEKGDLPDILIIDGGKGQLTMAEQVLEELQIKDLMLLAIAKGEERKPGAEKIFWQGGKEHLDFPRDSLAFRFLQHIRDEAHRYAIKRHRKKRNKTRITSVLENIAGVGGKKSQILLKYFGGLQGVVQAGIDDLQKVSGVNHKLAQRIYDYLHEISGLR